LNAQISEKEQAIKLTFFNSSGNKWIEVLDTNYRPYFFISHPITKKDGAFIGKLKVRKKVENKTELFTGQNVKLTRIELNEFSNSLQVSKNFNKSWENEVPVVSSYIYDKTLTFGAQYNVQRKKITPILNVPEKNLKIFEEKFSVIKKNDPEKYELLKKTFILCSQPIPEISLKRFGIKKKIDPEQYHLMFILARIANIPVPKTFQYRKVSTWIKSILYNHLRRKNILIPTANELRKGETKQSVQGALTLTPKPGVHFNTVVLDFDSMYPSLIDSYNLSFETIDCSHMEDKKNKVPEIEHHVCTKRRGVYSLLIGSLKDLRVHWFKSRSKDKTLAPEERRLAEATSKLLKMILVSSYGVTVRIHGLSRPSLAETITAYGRHSLRTAYKIAEDHGLHPIYGDTDSLFLEDPNEDQIELLIKTVKAKLKLDLSVEERYSLCVLPRAAKAYFGIRRDGTVDIKGLTAIKSNSPDFVNKVFKNCVQKLTNVKNQSELIKAKEKIKRIVWNAIRDLKAGKVPIKDLEYNVVIHENPEEKLKTKVLHQPYQCAKQLLNSGKTVKKGDIMRFVKVKPFKFQGKTFTVKPTDQVKNLREVNVKDYLRNLTTALNQTFKPMNIKFTDEIKVKRKLSDFLRKTSLSNQSINDLKF
jgi:DNA polymerase elongation subunit (family B)